MVEVYLYVYELFLFKEFKYYCGDIGLNLKFLIFICEKEVLVGYKYFKIEKFRVNFYKNYFIVRECGFIFRKNLFLVWIYRLVYIIYFYV